MGSSASQATGAARAHSRNVKRRKTKLVHAAIEHVYGVSMPDVTPARRAIVDALLELSEPRLRRLCSDAGMTGEEIAAVISRRMVG